MQLSLKPELARYIEEKIKTGQYASANEVVTGALELLRDAETLTADDVDELRREVAVGIDQIDRGETSSFSASDIQAEGRRILADRAKARE